MAKSANSGENDVNRRSIDPLRTLLDLDRSHRVQVGRRAWRTLVGQLAALPERDFDTAILASRLLRRLKARDAGKAKKV